MERSYTTRGPIFLKDTSCVPTGATLHVLWNDSPSTTQNARWEERILRLSGRAIGKALAGELPSDEQVGEWVFDSVCDTPTGDSVEPDGYGPDGCPSWLLILGMV